MPGWNSLDYGIVAIIAFGALYGLGRGVLRMTTSIVSLMAAAAAASSWHGRVGDLLQQRLATTPWVSSILGYIAVFAIVSVAIGIAGRRLVALVQLANLNLVDRLGGAIFGAALAVVFVGIDLMILTALLPPDSTLLRDSRLAPAVSACNDTLLGYIPPEAMKAYQEKREELLRYWNEHKENPVGGAKGTANGT
jgi:membrane protein required for colicin V production